MGSCGLRIQATARPILPDMLEDKSVEPKVAIVVLAAGMATRMGPEGGYKLLATFDGVPLVRRLALTALASKATSVTVVLGHRLDDMRKVLSDLSLNIVTNPDYASGMASSLTAGFAAVEPGRADGILVMLADMPGVTTPDLDQLILAFHNSQGTSILRAVSQGKRGNPVILPRSMYEAVSRLEGDIGARHLIETSDLEVIEVEIGEAARIDVDTPGDVIAAGGVLMSDSKF